MPITKLDYKLQGPRLEDAVADVLSRPNSINGKYEKGGGFGLDFYSENYKIENHRWIIERANIADQKIEEAVINGKNVDDLDILKEIAQEVDENIKIGKSNGSFINYFIYLIVPVVILIILFFVFL